MYEILLKPNGIVPESKLKEKQPIVKPSSQAEKKEETSAASETTPTRKKVSIRKGFDSGMVSIKALKKPKNTQTEEEQEQEGALAAKPKDAFTPESFEKVWKQYIGILKETGKSSFASTLEVSDPKLNGETILLEIENSVQEASLNAEKADLMDFLRKELNNFHISLAYNKVELKEEKRYYTNKERFNRLAELNPKLLELKKRFNLDTDY